jgi:hypothetical protein
MAGCYRCGGDMQAGGSLISAVSRASFRPQESRFLTLETGDVMTKATMCRSCGVIEIIGDVNKLRRLTGEPEPGTEKFLKDTLKENPVPQRPFKVVGR